MTDADNTRPSWRDNWTQLRVRKYYRDFLGELAKLYPDARPTSSNRLFEILVEEAGEALVHRDMGKNFIHTPDPYCPCSPTWPDGVSYE